MSQKTSDSSKRPRLSPDEATSHRIKQQFIQDYGLGYQMFGLPKLMGQVVGLLLFQEGPLSLTDITEELHVSKGPVSQIMRRLREHNLVRRVWVPGSRRDYYVAEEDIFGQAFTNHIKLQSQNLALARKYTAVLDETTAELPDTFARRMAEMERFYALMNKHLVNFLDEWQAEKGR